jgi:guanylate kinase
MNPLLFVISGPSGSGKTTLARAILADRALKPAVARSVSFTTRRMRTGEKDAKDYFFISAKEFRSMLRQKKILEWTRYLGYYYGTAREFVKGQLSCGRSLVLCLDVKGAAAIKKAFGRRAVTIFVIPPSVDVLRQRILNRCSRISALEVRRRLSAARSEMKAAQRYDHTVVNEDLGRARRELKKIIVSELKKR